MKIKPFELHLVASGKILETSLLFVLYPSLTADVWFAFRLGKILVTVDVWFIEKRIVSVLA